MDDVNETTQIMEREGFPAIQTGGFSDGYYAYYDTIWPLKILWEAYRKPKIMPSLQRYPDREGD